MTGRQSLVALAAILFAGGFAPTPVKAANFLTFVSRLTGADGAGCGAPSTPCKSIQTGLSETVPSGEIRCLDEPYDVVAIITAPVTIDCASSRASIFSFGSGGSILINVPEATYPNGAVTLRGLTINGNRDAGFSGVGHGIIVMGGGGSINIEDCRILNFSGKGIDFRPTSAVDLFVSDTIISANSGGGVYVVPAGGASVKGSLARVGLRSNGGIGLYLSKLGSATATITLLDSDVERNQYGVRANGANATILLDGSTIANNAFGLQSLAGGKLVSSGNNTINMNGTNGAPTSTAGQQ